MCTFPFSFEITEGEDRYVVSVSRRGEMSYSFADLKANGLSLVLG
ncbi:membrane protein [Mycobacterium tuberculosis]|uniref:Membrane protein n=1 Tax=Mycobacterium tuberculosis TaxID=1773 RepID=A0A916LI09_MYCTX|nr:membrane protein [Mycobacterium tuberculosis]CPB12479.1 membrane protein [Mycobacterium tuberculosis]